MKIILNQNVPGLGEKGEVKEVADGYARNFILPKKMAISATESAIEEIQKTKKEELKEESKKLAEIKSLAEKLSGKKFTIKVRAEKEKLFGSISPKEISGILKKEGFRVEEGKIAMPEHIKKTGEHEITINLDTKVKTKIKVVVEKE